MTDDRKRPIEILLIEDNPADVLLTKEALADTKIPHNMHTVADGLHAMRFLQKSDKYVDARRPDIILLDLNLPVKDGRQVLAELKADNDLRRIPVIVLTTSSREQDILTVYGLHANCYIVKPIDFSRFCEVIKAIENFWFQVVTLSPS
jgi:two-component system, chemotaxis family, response regulator Rcp1